MNRQFQSGTNLNGQGWHDELISQAQIWIDFLNKWWNKMCCMYDCFFFLEKSWNACKEWK